MEKRWYFVQVYSSMEKSVERALNERIARSDLQEQFGRVLVPTEEVVEMRNGKRVVVERRLYSGYVLIEMSMTDESWHLVKSTPKVSGFVGGVGNKPHALPQADVDKILVHMSGERPRPKIEFEVGETLRVTEGPFADFNGVVEEVNYERNKLRVTVTIFGRATPVELAFDQVEKVE
ncbi:transcription termination/antitermination protein NusG [Hydromonas duriensis]|uniref:Transcription termination/antitermination protein NusG n=1 Tax=Hydromonas duriensis TaxID=1527608 RepID=A0A4R6Y747_9BURK|nr:transcription termination/antitermination protein NusG [Hydromonas duriensis]TDR30930.1 transcription antitermination protein nusG [Hydromonas duriensis]